MADINPFDEDQLNTLEKYLSSDHNDAEQIRSDTLLTVLGHMAGLYRTDQPNASAIFKGLLVEPANPGVDMTITIFAGLGLIRDQTGSWATEGRSQVRPLQLLSDQTITLSNGDGSNPRIDRILMKAAYYEAENESRQVKNIAVTPPVFTGSGVNKRRRMSARVGTYAQFVAGNAEICIKEGTPAASPSAPTVDAGAISLCQISVSTGVTSITDSSFTDERIGAYGRGSSPRVRMHIEASQGASFSYGSHVLTLEEQGLFISLVSRVGTGRWRITLEGVTDATFSSTGFNLNVGYNIQPEPVIPHYVLKGRVQQNNKLQAQFDIILRDQSGTDVDVDFTVDVWLHPSDNIVGGTGGP